MVKKKKTGWKSESARHALASKGIATGSKKTIKKLIKKASKAQDTIPQLNPMLMRIARFSAKADMLIYGKKSKVGKLSKIFVEGTTNKGIVKKNYRQTMTSKYWK